MNLSNKRKERKDEFNQSRPSDNSKILVIFYILETNKFYVLYKTSRLTEKTPETSKKESRQPVESFVVSHSDQILFTEMWLCTKSTICQCQNHANSVRKELKDMAF
ncbi:hypothetical protein NPIL_20401 [Nephila pilipes]|uniref:Uncharacterized protein n=1 Tax=Nephila pilipes TaxID=299642 RepID=A0A8X6P0B0_NEPPI|nr:hypothetical protein NPIL_20401 [Nephila pilipes]